MPEYYVDAKIVTTFRKKITAVDDEAARASLRRGLTYEESEIETSEYISSEIVDSNGEKVA